MKKISEGKYEIFTTKEDAIHKFRQIQGVCREYISDEKPIEFFCSKKGEITITNPPTQSVERENSTNLFAEVIQQDGKTYVTYYTTFSQLNNVLKMIILAMDIIIAIFAIIFAIINVAKNDSLIVLVFGLAFFVFNLFTSTKEKNNSSIDSEILIKELEKKVIAVNRWDE